MIEGRTVPTRGAMALLAGLGESRLHVVGILRPLEIFQVAADAVRIGFRQVVIVVDVALGALHRRVRAGQRESRGRVIERGVIPRGRVVALGAILRESRVHVVGIGRALEIFQVATDAGCIRVGQVVIAVHVALRALHGGVRSGQRESRGGVIKSRVVPVGRVMALLTGLREPGLNVVRIRGGIEVLDVTRSAIAGRSDEIPIDMALCAGHG